MTPARPLAVVFAAALLAACGGDAAEEGGVAAEASSQASTRELRAETAKLELTPGRWQTRIEPGAMEIPGVSPAMMAQMMKDGMKAAEVVTCLSADDINGRGQLFETGQNNCKVARYSLSGGEIDIAQSCAAPGGQGRADIAMTGSYTPDSYTIDMTVKAAADGGPVPATTVKSRVIGKRLGECDGSEANAKR